MQVPKTGNSVCWNFENDGNVYRYFPTSDIGTAINLSEAINSFNWPDEVEGIDILNITEAELENITNFVACEILKIVQKPQAFYPWPEDSDMVKAKLTGKSIKSLNSYTAGIFNETRRKKTLEPSITFPVGGFSQNLHKLITGGIIYNPMGCSKFPPVSSNEKRHINACL